MELRTTAQALHETINLAARISPSHAQLAAYTGVHLEVSSGQLLARGSDGDTTVTARLNVDEAKKGSVLVPHEALLKYLSTLPDDAEVTMTSPSATSVEVRAGDGTPYTFKAMADSFPAAPTTRREKVPADLSRLADAVAAVADCAGSLSGGSDEVVQLVSTPQGLKLHSTDRYRVARAQLGEGSGFGGFDGLLPLRVLTLVARISPTHVQLDPKGRDMVFHGETAVISTRLAQDPFPVVDSVLAATVPYAATVPRRRTLAALRRLSAVAVPGGAVNIAVTGDQLRLTVSNPNRGSGTEEVTLGEAASGELETMVNLDYFRSALNTHTTTEVTVSWLESLKPLFVTSSDPLPTTHAIMPLQA